MRPETLRYKMDRAFETYFSGAGSGGFKPLLRELKRLMAKQMKIENDPRTGEETYGYVEVEIPSHMMYISDRWRVAFRLRWLVEGIETGKIK